ncbi:MAG: dockerin type I domain-containing protein [Pirellulales bacterium]
MKRASSMLGRGLGLTGLDGHKDSSAFIGSVTKRRLRFEHLEIRMVFDGALGHDATIPVGLEDGTMVVATEEDPTNLADTSSNLFSSTIDPSEDVPFSWPEAMPDWNEIVDAFQEIFSSIAAKNPSWLEEAFAADGDFYNILNLAMNEIEATTEGDLTNLLSSNDSNTFSVTIGKEAWDFRWNGGNPDLVLPEENPFCNLELPTDVDGNGLTSTSDIDLLMQRLNDRGPYALPTRTLEDTQALYLDSNNDRLFTPLDVLIVINEQMEESADQEGTGDEQVMMIDDSLDHPFSDPWIGPELKTEKTEADDSWNASLASVLMEWERSAA